MRVASAAAGVIVGIGVLEGGLRMFESPAEPPRPRIIADSLDRKAVTIRQLDEGVSVAHFSTTGARLTGNPPLADGPVVVILGDSYVMAREVDDRETMGGQLERIARASGTPLNVRQYGWTGASPAQYVLVAGDIRARWGASDVVVVLSQNDFDARAVNTLPRFQVNESTGVRIVGGMVDTVSGSPLPSTLWMLVQHRWSTLRHRAPVWARPPRDTAITTTVSDGGEPALPSGPTRLDLLPDATVRALSAAYGARLLLVYIAEVGVRDGEVPTAAEGSMFAACRAAGVRCISTRARMLEMRRRGEIGIGLSTRDIGIGHLNPVGHRVMADAMWDVLAADFPTRGPLERR